MHLTVSVAYGFRLLDSLRKFQDLPLLDTHSLNSNEGYRLGMDQDQSIPVFSVEM